MSTEFKEDLQSLAMESQPPNQSDDSVAWSWHIEDDVFSVDSTVIASSLKHNAPINKIEDLVSIMSDISKEAFINMLKNTIQDKGVHFSNIGIKTQNKYSFYCLVKARWASEKIIIGYIKPLIYDLADTDISALFYQLVNCNHHGIVVTDSETKILACNSYIEKSSGYSQEELVGQKTNVFNAAKHSPSFFTSLWNKVNNDKHWSGHILSRRKDGKCIPQELTIQKVIIGDNVFYLGITLDLSKRLYRIEEKDHGGIELLTQLPSEGEFKKSLVYAITELQEGVGLQLLTFTPTFSARCEIEEKKSIASALSFFNGKLVAGYLGGNTFAIALPYKLTEEEYQLKSLYEAIKALAAYLRKELSSNVFATLSNCSIGVSVLGTDADSSTKLISHALQAMYDNYNESGNNINFYNNTLHQKVSRRAGLEEIVRNSIKNKTFMVYYQPIVNTNNWQVTKFEALCRFKDKNGQILNTQEMITITEDLGLISDLDISVAQQAIADRKRLSKYFNRQVEVTINFSMNSEDSITKTFNKIFKMLRPYARDWPYITIELTESGYFDSEELAEGILYALRKKGIKVAIDDFGTGYSSFSYLKDGNFDLLKIDREFVRDISKNTPNYHIVKTIVGLAHTLGVAVIAEGVENISEVTILKALDVDFIQGFLFSKPMPVERTVPNIGYKKLIADINTALPVKKSVKLVLPTPTVSNSDDLSVVKAVYETHKSDYVAVVDGKHCVGLIHKANYNLHVSPSVGTSIETTSDLRLLQKKTHQIMDSLLFRVNIKINHSELFEFIEQDQPFPWVVEDGNGAFIGLITKTSALRTVVSGS